MAEGTAAVLGTADTHRPVGLTASSASAGRAQITDILDEPCGDDAIRWSRTNFTEALPGVVSTLTWDLWRYGSEVSGRRIFRAMGLLDEAETVPPPNPAQRLTGIRHGRPVANVSAFRAILDRMPGASGDAFEEQLLGTKATAGDAARPAKRWLSVIAGLPFVLWGSGRNLRNVARDVAEWRRDWLLQIAKEGSPAARAALADVHARMADIFTASGKATFAQQAVSAMLAKLLPPGHGTILDLASGEGLPETRYSEAIWNVAHGAMTREALLEEFGYFGSDTGDCAKPSIRARPELLEPLIAAYAGLSEPPTAALAQVRQRRRAAEAQMFANMAAAKRPLARALLAWCDRLAVAREVGKSAWLMATDVARAAGETVGRALVADGIARTADDAFHLTIEELTAPADPALRETIAYRRALHAWRHRFDVPTAFAGEPDLLPITAHEGGDAKGTPLAPGDVIEGMPASPGTVTGRARIVHDAMAPGDFAKGDILVCRITDPSWSPLIALAGAVVADVGGMLSHGAIVAREFGVPAVVNTKTGSQAIAPGAWLKVDGATGRVTVLEDSRQGPDIHKQSILNQNGGTAFWSRVNYAEAMPGAATPLNASLWNASQVFTSQMVFARMGVISPASIRKPRTPEETPGGFFYGRAAANVDVLRAVGDATPGTSGAMIEENYLGLKRAHLKTRKRYARYPIAIVKIVHAAATLPREVRKVAAEVDAWWRRARKELADADAPTARRWLEDAFERFPRVATTHGLVTMLGPAAWEQVRAAARKAGAEDLVFDLSAGYEGLEETHMAARLFRVAHGEETIDAFLDDYGFRAPDEGKISSRSWREDPAPLQALLAAKRLVPADRHPAAVSAAAVARRRKAAAELLRKTPAWKRPGVRAALRYAERIVPLRETSKAACLAKPIDVGRIAARALGRRLAAEGVIDDADDVFMLTLEELLDPDGGDHRALVNERRAIVAAYEELDIPESFQGTPAPRPKHREHAQKVHELAGIGVSAGTARGRAKIVLDPSQTDGIAHGDIIVCHTTDPAWTPILALAGGLIVDIGGMLSHAAIVAREFGVPCIVNTRTGTRDIPDGATVTMDGGAGTVAIA